MSTTSYLNLVFQISNRVTEFHYSDSENGHDRTVDECHDIIDETYDNRVFDNNEEELDEQQPPPPVYPTINNKKSWNYKLADKKNTFTKDQIIDLYCAAGQTMDNS